MKEIIITIGELLAFRSTTELPRQAEIALSLSAWANILLIINALSPVLATIII